MTCGIRIFGPCQLQIIRYNIMKITRLYAYGIALFLFALLCSCKKKDPVAMDQIIALSVSDTLGLQADGKMKIRLEVQLPADAAEGYKKITFSATSGIFDGTTTSTKDVRIDNEGKAIAYLTVSTVPGIFYVSASTGSSVAYKVECPVYLRPVTTNNKLAVTVTDTTGIRADNYSIFKISAQVANSTETTVKFTINEGFILGPGEQKSRVIPVDNYGKAEILIRTDINAMTYLLSTQSNSTTIVNDVIPVRRACADTVILEPTALKIDSTGGSVTIKAILNRINGKVSQQTPVFFDSYQIDNALHEKPTGRFAGQSNNGTNANGEVSIHFFADTGMLLNDRPIKIRVKTKKDNGTFITVILNLLIN